MPGGLHARLCHVFLVICMRDKMLNVEITRRNVHLCNRCLLLDWSQSLLSPSLHSSWAPKIALQNINFRKLKKTLKTKKLKKR